MLTAKEIKSLPKGDYPNWRLQKMFGKRQGNGRSALIQLEKIEGKEGQKPSFVEKLINAFTGKPVVQRKMRTQQHKG